MLNHAPALLVYPVCEFAQIALKAHVFDVVVLEIGGVIWLQRTAVDAPAVCSVTTSGGDKRKLSFVRLIIRKSMVS